MTTRPTSAVLLVLAGAVCLAWSAVLVTWAGTDAGTTAVLRCILGGLVLAPWVRREIERHGMPSRSALVGAGAAGLLLGVDMLLYTESILRVGAGVSALVLNTQLLAFPLLARALDKQRVSRRFLVLAPVLLLGVGLTGGLGGASPSSGFLLGAALGAGAGLAYAGYLYLSRRSTGAATRHPMTLVSVASLAAAVSAAALALPTSGVTVPGTLRAWVCLAVLALVGQALAWLFVQAGCARLSAQTSAVLLASHPVLAVALGVLVLGEHLSGLQATGGAVVVTAMLLLAAPVPARYRQPLPS